MPEDFLVARNPDGDSKLPYLLRIPLGEQGVILKARDSWPRTAKVYCHRVDAWTQNLAEQTLADECAEVPLQAYDGAAFSDITVSP